MKGIVVKEKEGYLSYAVKKIDSEEDMLPAYRGG